MIKFGSDKPFCKTKIENIKSKDCFLSVIKTVDKKRPRRSVVYKMVAMTRLELVTPAL